MKTIETTVYQFSELSKEAKQKAIDSWYESENYDFLKEDLAQFVAEKLNENNIEASELNVLYSLNYSQGDGLCFTGSFEKDGQTLVITHSWRYYYAGSVDMQFFNNEGEAVDNIPDLKDFYLNICAKAEKYGYSILEYRMTFDEASELFEVNGYEFTQNGEMI